jgi:hypothetical protein
MKKLPHILAICLTIGWPTFAVSSGIWKPELNFSLEGRTLRHTMLWVSGFSDAIDAIGKMELEAPRQKPFCSPENGFIGSKALFEILNERFMGQIITSEQATGEIMKQLPKRFPC